MSTSDLLQPVVQAVQWQNDACVLLDQTKLPSQEVYLRCERTSELVDAIRALVVRGAPAIGIAGAYGAVLLAKEVLKVPEDERREKFLIGLSLLEEARPTAVNLKWAVDRMRSLALQEGAKFTPSTVGVLLEEAKHLHLDDIESNRKMAKFGASLLTAGGEVITVCNTGDLATGGIGTAFGVFREGFLQKKVDHVYACETRPVLQGLRLTTWELEKNKIPYTVISDNMAGTVMRRKKISAVITGADRIAANGDVANKIGTYTLAVLAKHHGIPFIVAAPVSTFDMATKSGNDIPIEERNGEEILSILGKNRHAYGVSTYNPAFDVTPNELISALVCERGIIEKPNESRMKAFFEKEQLE